MILKKYRLRRWQRSLKIGDTVRDCHGDPHTVVRFTYLGTLKFKIFGSISDMEYLIELDDGSWCDLARCLQPLDKLPLFARKNKDAPWIRRRKVSHPKTTHMVRPKRLPKV